MSDKLEQRAREHAGCETCFDRGDCDNASDSCAMKRSFTAGAKAERTEVIRKIRDWARNEPIGYRQYSTIDLLDFLKLIEEEGL